MKKFRTFFYLKPESIRNIVLLTKEKSPLVARQSGTSLLPVLAKILRPKERQVWGKSQFKINCLENNHFGTTMALGIHYNIF